MATIPMIPIPVDTKTGVLRKWRTVVYMPNNRGYDFIYEPIQYANIDAVRFLIEQGMVQADDIKKKMMHDPSIPCRLPRGWSAVKYHREVRIHWKTPYKPYGDYIIVDRKGRARVDCQHNYTFVRNQEWFVTAKLLPRFVIKMKHDFEANTMTVYITDGGRDKGSFSATGKYGTSGSGFTEVMNTLKAAAKAWLDEHYPNSEDVNAHWDD